MTTARATLFAVSLIAHAVTAVALIALFVQTRAMTGFCAVSGALIGAAAAAARPGRPVTLYVAFGLLLGYSFWAGVSAVNQRQLLDLILVGLIVGGAVWLLEAPSVPAALFAALAAALSLALAVAMDRQRFTMTVDADLVWRTAITAVGVLGLGLLYIGLGTAEVLLPGERSRRKKKRRPTG